MSARYETLREEYEKHLERAYGFRTLMLDEAARFLVANPLSGAQRERVSLEASRRQAEGLLRAARKSGDLPGVWCDVIEAWLEKIPRGHRDPAGSLRVLWERASAFDSARLLVEEVL